MYGVKDYAARGARFLNNQVFPGRKTLSTLMIYATDLCDSGCKHCLIWAKRPVVHLPKEKIIELLHDRVVTKNTIVGLEGGEFLLHPEALDIMAWLHEYHPNFDLLSNCLKPDGVIEAVKKYPPKRLYISLDGDKETYHYMRGKDGYDSVIKVIEALHKTVPISAMFTLSPYNSFDDLQHVAEVCKKYDIDLRVGVYNDIAFFDTVEKAHEFDIGAKKDDKKVLKFKDVREGLKEEFQKKGAELSAKQRQNLADPKHRPVDYSDFKNNIPPIIKEFRENYDFLVLYDEWRRKNTKLKCYSILDSLVVLPNGDVPICQNLDLKLGNVYEKSLNEIFNGEETQAIHHQYVHNCNQCWINFHRKYDVVMYRSFEKFFPKQIVGKLFGYYQWEGDRQKTYGDFLTRMEAEYN